MNYDGATYQAYYNYVVNYTVYVNEDGTFEAYREPGSEIECGDGVQDTDYTLGSPDPAGTIVEDFCEECDLTKDGGTQPSGWQLVSKNALDGADKTRQKTTHPVGQIDISELVDAVGGFGQPQKYGNGLEQMKQVVDGLEKAWTVFEPTPVESGDSGGNGGGETGGQGVPPSDSNNSTKTTTPATPPKTNSSGSSGSAGSSGKYKYTPSKNHRI